MIALIIVIFVLVCLGGTRKWTKKTAANTAEMVRWAKLPDRLKENEYINNLPRAQRREVMRRQMIELHGDVAQDWSHSTVRAAYNGWQLGSRPGVAPSATDQKSAARGEGRMEELRRQSSYAK